MNSAVYFLFLLFATLPYVKKAFDVAKTGNNQNNGSLKSPLGTISAAALRAQPGDVVIVHSGTYRERIDPSHSGASEKKRIVYQAAPGEHVVITGAEAIKSWVYLKNDTWKAVLPNSYFGNFNPYKDLIHGDWFYAREKAHHTGSVYVNGEWLMEAKELWDVLKPAGDK